MKEAQRGVFITFEGGEGCGKSTQCARLAEALRAAGKDVLSLREPGGTPLAEEIRRLIKHCDDDPPCPRAELLLFLAARAQLVATAIRPALEAGRWVVCDRFGDSTVAYQGAGRGFPDAIVAEADAFARDGIAPDVTFFLDASFETSCSRVGSRATATGAAKDRFEREPREFHERIRRRFAEIAAAEPHRVKTIDANRPADEVWSDVWTSMKPFL